MNDGLGWKRIAHINGTMIGAQLALFYGWVCWQAATIEWWGLWLVGGLSLFGGGLMFLAGLGKLFAAINTWLELRKFKVQGVEARADKGVSHNDLKDRGMMR